MALLHRYRDKIMDKKAQVFLELGLLIILVVAALLSMQGYLRRAIQGKWKSDMDSFSDGQYEKGAGFGTDTDTGLEFVSPKITTNLGYTYTKSSSAGYINITNWGKYYDPREGD